MANQTAGVATLHFHPANVCARWHRESTASKWAGMPTWKLRVHNVGASGVRIGVGVHVARRIALMATLHGHSTPMCAVLNNCVLEGSLRPLPAGGLYKMIAVLVELVRDRDWALEVGLPK